MKLCGIYQIKNLVNNKVYIGKDKNLPNRLKMHFIWLCNNKHPNKHLQRSFNKYGLNNFEYCIIRTCSLYQLGKTEKATIKKLQSNNRLFGFNKTFGGDGGDTLSLMEVEKLKKYKENMSNILKKTFSNEEIRATRSIRISGENNPMSYASIMKTYNYSLEEAKIFRKKLAKKTKSLELFCVFCKNKFLVKPSRKFRKFCSLKCCYASRNNKSLFPMWKKIFGEHKALEIEARRKNENC